MHTAAIVKYRLDPPAPFGALNFHPRSPLSSKNMNTEFDAVPPKKSPLNAKGSPKWGAFVTWMDPEADALTARLRYPFCNGRRGLLRTYPSVELEYDARTNVAMFFPQAGRIFHAIVTILT